MKLKLSGHKRRKNQRASVSIQEADVDKGRKFEVVSIIKDSFEVQKLLKQLIQSATENVSLAVPTTATDLFFPSQFQDIPSSVASAPSRSDSSFPTFSCSLFFQLIKDIAAGNENLGIKILTNAEHQIRENKDGMNVSSILGQAEREAEGKKLSNINVKYMEQDYSSLNENIVILVVDRRASLAIELEERGKGHTLGEKDEAELDHKKNSSYRMIKLATYSENKSTVLSYISIFESLWKEIELNEKVTSLLAEIKRRENIERDFINMAAHELRAPIQPVLGLAQILQSKKNVGTKEQEELLSVIIRNARRLNILTENLLDLAKIESNTLKLQKETFDLSELISEATADVKSQLTSHQVDVEVVNVEYDDGSAKNFQEVPNNADSKISQQDKNHHFLVEGDKIRIMQVISNLLANAIKFTRGGKVVIGLAKDKNFKGSNRKGEGEEEGEEEQGSKGEREVIVSFKDSGTGIDPGILDKIFEKFVTKSDKGTGLGLFISRKIVEAHGGKIWAKNNTPEEGATITFSLPQ